MTDLIENSKYEDLNACVFAAAAGDDEAFSLLAKSFAPALGAILSGFLVPPEEKEDLRQEGLLGLYKAVLLYKPSLSSFSTFAGVCMRSAVFDAVKRLQKKPDALPQGAPEAASLSADPARILVGKEELSVLLGRIDSVLSPMERKVLLLHLEGKTSTEIARRLGIGKRSADNALFRLRRKLKEGSEE